MYQVIGCLTERHDLLLVATAAAVCVLASVATFALLGRAEAARGWGRRIWLGLAAVAAGERPPRFGRDDALGQARAIEALYAAAR